jgi:hypothetical protein
MRVFQRKLIRVTTDPRNQGLFAWPFKVLHDLFCNPPFVADPEFTPFEIDAVQAKSAREISPAPKTYKLALIDIDRSQLTLFIWLAELILVLIALIVLG